MLILDTGAGRLINYIFIIPSFLYNLVVFPAWHRCRFGPEALMAKLLYGWSTCSPSGIYAGGSEWAGR